MFIFFFYYNMKIQICQVYYMNMVKEKAQPMFQTVLGILIIKILSLHPFNLTSVMFLFIIIHTNQKNLTVVIL